MAVGQLVSRRGVLTMTAGGLTAAGLAATGLATAPAAEAAADTGPAGVQAPWAMLADAATGANVWSRWPATARPMGSITKVMTAFIVLKANQLGRVITVPSAVIPYVRDNNASSAGLVPGERLTVRDLLIAMMLPSGCDASFTLASAYGGLPAFIATMNATARAHGLTHTHFTDPSGLPIGGEYATYSCASNLVALGRAAMRITAFREIVEMRGYHLAAGSGHYAHTWTNLNPLLGSYPGAIGIKTGFTSAAGDCLLFEATRGGRTLIGVVLHSSSSIYGLPVAGSDAEKMLNWGFAH
jgi:D-alanyl-D-alanine carboxypeptidase (penicillin-binding protein 5/6)